MIEPYLSVGFLGIIMSLSKINSVGDAKMLAITQ
jgi:hypothetical protein